jgi:TPR repeat protein
VESNYDHAITLYQNAAKYGDINSLRRLNVIYRQNDAVPQNISMVNSYLETRAKLGDPEGCNELAMTYILGIGKNIDYSKGIKHLEKAASLNCINAQFNLAKAYAIGKIVPKDSHKSFNYHKLAAETKHPEGIYRLGCLYLTGYSHIKRNVRKAIKLLNDAAKCGHILSCYKLAHIYRCKKYGEQNVKLAKL